MCEHIFGGDDQGMRYSTVNNNLGGINSVRNGKFFKFPKYRNLQKSYKGMKEERVHEFLVTGCLGTELADKKSNQKGIKGVKRGH